MDIEPKQSQSFEGIKKTSPQGGEYWMARDLQGPLGYVRWENFVDVINKAIKSCEGTGLDPDNHIRQTAKLVTIGSGGQRKVCDYYVDRYGAYLIAMNGDPKLPQIAEAQSYFAIQTRKQELLESGQDINKRLELRRRVIDANKHLGNAAKDSGVQNWALFHAAGYRGLYGLNLKEIKERKGLQKDENLLDRAGRAELAANEFRITQTEQILVRDSIKGDIQARQTHEEVGKKVRDTIKNIGGTMPEDLPAEPSIKKLVLEDKKRKKNLLKTSKKNKV